MMPPISLPVRPGPGPRIRAPAKLKRLAQRTNKAPKATTTKGLRPIERTSRTCGLHQLKGSPSEWKAGAQPAVTPGSFEICLSGRVGACHHTDRTLVGGAEQHDASEAGVAAYAHNAGIGDNVKIDRPQEMCGLIDGAHCSVTVPRG